MPVIKSCTVSSGITKDAFYAPPCGDSVFLIIKQTYCLLSTICTDLYKPFGIGRAPTYARSTAGIITPKFLVSGVLFGSAIGKIVPTIIRRIPVNMIDVVRIIACDKFPDNAVRKIGFTVYGSPQIAGCFMQVCESWFTFPTGIPGFVFASSPEKQPCFLLIVEKLLKPVLRRQVCHNINPVNGEVF